MNTTKYHLQVLKQFLEHHKIATLGQLKSVLGSPARCTIFRKLGELEYLSSYSHRGKYYTLRSIARFTNQGLWEYQSVWFSHFGNLLDTAEAFVHNSEAGYTASELKDVLHVKTKHALIQLSRCGRVHRELLDSVYIYFSGEKRVGALQRKTRKAQLQRSSASLIVVNPDLATEEAKAAVLLFFSTLDERQRRLYAGLESLKLGYGGDAHIASILGIDPHTVARGRQEIISEDLRHDRIRAKGGGRLSQEKKPPKS